jgi:hypothetical protein
MTITLPADQLSPRLQVIWLFAGVEQPVDAAQQQWKRCSVDGIQIAAPAFSPLSCHRTAVGSALHISKVYLQYS